MSVNLSLENIEFLQGRYSSLINYTADDPFSPIDPATYVDSNGDTLLHIAVLEGDFESVSILLGAGFDVNSLGDLDNTPMHYAQKVGNQEIIAALTSAGARLDSENVFGKTPLEMAVKAE